MGHVDFEKAEGLVSRLLLPSRLLEQAQAGDSKGGVAHRRALPLNKRGLCEQYIKEGKRTLTWTRFSSNQVRLALFVLAYNMGNFMRRFALPSEVSHWSLSSIQLKLVKIGAKVVSHSRRTIFQMAEVAVSEALFAALLERIRCMAGAPT
jgi:hypothetical protein